MEVLNGFFNDWKSKDVIITWFLNVTKLDSDLQYCFSLALRINIK